MAVTEGDCVRCTTMSSNVFAMNSLYQIMTIYDSRGLTKVRIYWNKKFISGKEVFLVTRKLVFSGGEYIYRLLYHSWRHKVKICSYILLRPKRLAVSSFSLKIRFLPVVLYSIGRIITDLSTTPMMFLLR